MWQGWCVDADVDVDDGSKVTRMAMNVVLSSPAILLHCICDTTEAVS